MRPAVHEDRPVERAHELEAVADDLARDRIQVLQDARAADAAPLVRRRVRPALILRRAPDRFRRGVGAQAAGLVEREAEVIGERRLPGVLGAVEAPFAGDVRRPRALGVTRRLTTVAAAAATTSRTIPERIEVGWSLAAKAARGAVALGQDAPGGVGQCDAQHTSIREGQLHRVADEFRERRGHPRIHHAFDFEEPGTGRPLAAIP